MNKYSYKGKLITASSKQEAIQKIVAGSKEEADLKKLVSYLNKKTRLNIKIKKDVGYFKLNGEQWKVSFDWYDNNLKKPLEKKPIIIRMGSIVDNNSRKWETTAEKVTRDILNKISKLKFGGDVIVKNGKVTITGEQYSKQAEYYKKLGFEIININNAVNGVTEARYKGRPYKLYWKALVIDDKNGDGLQRRDLHLDGNLLTKQIWDTFVNGDPDDYRFYKGKLVSDFQINKKNLDKLKEFLKSKKIKFSVEKERTGEVINIRNVDIYADFNELNWRGKVDYSYILYGGGLDKVLPAKKDSFEKIITLLKANGTI